MTPARLREARRDHEERLAGGDAQLRPHKPAGTLAQLAAVAVTVLAFAAAFGWLSAWIGPTRALAVCGTASAVVVVAATAAGRLRNRQ